jgi:hypothetical protein
MTFFDKVRTLEAYNALPKLFTDSEWCAIEKIINEPLPSIFDLSIDTSDRSIGFDVRE